MLQKGTSTAGDVSLVKANGNVVKAGEAKEDSQDPVSTRLAQIYKRLELIDAYSAEARAAAILAVSIIYFRMLLGNLRHHR